MSIQEKYENLPGVKVDYEDGNLYSGANNLSATTQSVLLIGSAIDGPVGTVVSVAQIGGPKAAEQLYGGMFKKELRDAVPTLAEYNAPYDTALVGSTNIITLTRAATGETPVVMSSVAIKQGTTTLLRVNNVADVVPGRFHVDPSSAVVTFAEPLYGLKVTYDVLQGQSVKVPHQGNLVRGMYELLNAGCEDIRMLRIAGRKAKTELMAKDPAQELLDTLGVSAGSHSFNGSLVLDIGVADSARLVKSQSNPLAALRYVREIDKDSGQTVSEYTGNAMADVVLNIDHTTGAEKVYFKANSFRPKNKVEVGYQFIRRTNQFINHLDVDGALTKSTDPTLPKFYESNHPFWSDDAAMFAEFEIYIEDTSGSGGKMKIPMTDLAGSIFYWKFGKSPETDISGGIRPNADGGITFLPEYDSWAAAQVPQYPQLSSPTTKVTASYWYYSESTPIQDDNTGEEFVAPGSTQAFDLKYNPSADDFRIYFEKGQDTFDLAERTAANPGGHYTLDLSGDKPRVVIEAGVAPVGAKFVASYKTSDNVSSVNPRLIVEGLHGGSVYGQVTDVYTEETKGVEVEVRKDEEDGTSLELVFYKPEEKRLTTKDVMLVYKFKNLRGIQTLGELANYINNDTRNNNIVSLTAPGHASQVRIEGLLETGGPVMLGTTLDNSTGAYVLKKDETKDINDPDHFPYCGTDGFFNVNDLRSMKDLYDSLGGVYKEVEGKGMVLVEQGVYNKIENYATDIIVVLEAHSNSVIGREDIDAYTGQPTIVRDTTRNFATQLAQHCAIVTAKTWETIGVIGTRASESTDLFSVQEYVDELTIPGSNEHFMYNEGTGELILTDEGETMDIGRYVNVVFGPELGQMNARLGGYVAGGATLYAGLISGLPAENSTTNKEVAAQGARYDLSEAQMNQLSGGRYVTFEQKRDLNGATRVVVKDGVTAALPTSDYNRLSTVRITHATVQLIRRKADPYIGLPNGMAQRNSLATEIQAGLDRLKELGVLQDFRFSIFTSAKEKVLGNAFITLELVPQFETRKIYTSVALRSSL